MKLFGALLAVFAASTAVGAPEFLDLKVHGEKDAIRQEMIDEVNSKNVGWTAGSNSKFEGKNLVFAKSMLGTRLDDEAVKSHKAMPVSTRKVTADLPQTFDAAAAWPECAGLITKVRDQASCGSCWAFGSTEAFNDRACIANNVTVEFSTQDTTSCCNLFGGCFGSQGCNGGMPSEAWSYFVNKGVVTGGDYDDVGKGDSCFPYQLKTCCHHVTCPYSDCTEGGSTPACPSQKCSEAGYKTAWSQDLHKAATSYSLGSVEQIQADLVEYGSVTAAFSVYEDFLTYKSGVYKHTTGQMLGGHAVKIQGYGEENGTPYWLVLNSWNEYWGDKGYFKIARGSDECGIEDMVSAGHA